MNKGNKIALNYFQMWYQYLISSTFKQLINFSDKGNVTALTFLQMRHQFVHNVLHGSVEGDVVEGVGLVDNLVAGGAGVLLLEVLHET